MNLCLLSLMFLSVLTAPALAAPATSTGPAYPRKPIRIIDLCTTPDELARFMRVEHARWERVVKTTGLAPRD